MSHVDKVYTYKPNIYTEFIAFFQAQNVRNAFSAGAPLQTSLEELTTLPQAP